MKVLIIGSGGREHALVWKIAQSPQVEKIFCTPGNAGTADLAENIPLSSEDISALLNFAVKNKIDLTIVGPEAPLVLGIADEFEKKKLKIFGPSQTAAQIEGSKVFAKKLMKNFDIPNANYAVFNDAEAAIEYAKINEFPLVIKADGLAAGKGVSVVNSAEEAEALIYKTLVEKTFGDAGNKIIIEEYLEGIEASILAITDGKSFITLPSAQDHKAIFDGDRGPNTGGMGAYSPAPMVTEEILKEVEEKIIAPTIQGLAKLGSPYKGVLYAGLMLTKEGPKVLEFNCRLGDPEAQVILPRLKTDFIEIVEAVLNNNLENLKIEMNSGSCVCVVLASGGYPGKFNKGMPISGLDEIKANGVMVFHAGTELKERGAKSEGRRTKEKPEIITSGGRVLGVTALKGTLKEAREASYSAIAKIHFANMHFRKDIGAKALGDFSV